jgi:hypothetical protein
VWRHRGSEESEAGRRVQEVQIQTPRSGFADPRWKVRREPNAGVRSQIPRPDVVVHRGPEEVPEERPGLQRRRPPRDVIDKFLVFFCSGLSYRSAGDLACKPTVRPITVFCKSSCYFISLSFVSSSAARFLPLLKFFFSFEKRGEARGNGPTDRGRRRRIASMTISGFAFGSPFLFLIFVFESHLLF